MAPRRRFSSPILGYSEKRTYEAVKNGTIPSIKLGPRKIRIPTAWLRQQLGLAEVA